MHSRTMIRAGSNWTTGVLLFILLQLEACISITIAPARMADDGSGQFLHIRDGVL